MGCRLLKLVLIPPTKLRSSLANQQGCSWTIEEPVISVTEFNPNNPWEDSAKLFQLYKAILTCWLRIEISGTAPTGLHGLCTKQLMPSVQSTSSQRNVDTESAWLLPPRICIIHLCCCQWPKSQQIFRPHAHLSKSQQCPMIPNMAQFVNGSQWISHMDRGPDLDKAIRARLKPYLRPFDHDHTAQVAEAAVRMCIVLRWTLCLLQLQLDLQSTFLQSSLGVQVFYHLLKAQI